MIKDELEDRIEMAEDEEERKGYIGETGVIVKCGVWPTQAATCF
jgi:hypothetical protein